MGDKGREEHMEVKKYIITNNTAKIVHQMRQTVYEKHDVEFAA